MVISWHQDGIFFARMGMTDAAADYNNALIRIAAAADMITSKVRQKAHTPRRRTFVAVDDVRGHVIIIQILSTARIPDEAAQVEDQRPCSAT